MTTDTQRVYRIPDFALARLLDRLEALNRRAAVLGCAPIAAEVVGVEDVSDDVTGYVKRYHLVRVVGESPRLAGWRLLAVLQHVEGGGVIVRAVPGSEGLLASSWREAGPYCEHCGTTRARKDTFVLGHEGGAVKQVGRNCLADFLGHVDPEALAAWAEALVGILGDAEEYEEAGRGGGWGKLLNLEDYLVAVCVAIRAHGWLSRKSAEAQGKSGRATAEVAGDIMRDWRLGKGDSVEACDTALAALALAWGRGLGERARAEGKALSDYEHNLAVVISLEAIEEKMMGIAASLIPAYQRTLETASPERAESNWVGEVGKRMTLVVEVLAIRELPGFRDGVTYLHKMRDEAGNDLAWFSSSGALAKGAHTLTGTVKNHDVYNGRKQTLLTRCKAVEAQ